MDLAKLTEESKEFLKSCGYYNIAYTDLIIDTWYENKKELIEKFKKHPNYNGRGQIVLTEKFERAIDLETAKKELIYFTTLFDTPNVKIYEWLLYAILSNDKFIDKQINEELYNFVIPFINEEYNGENDEQLMHQFSVGGKLSKFVRKVCLAGIENLDECEFEKHYAKFSDSVNPLSVVKYTILSVNPMDYWGMSIGNSWNSCHDIRQDRGPGCYSSGTESYMLDQTSFVMYTIDNKSDISRPELCKKITRQMFHIGELFLVQSRLYPQDMDGVSGEYRYMREIAQRVISQIYKIPNYWTNKRGIRECTSLIKTIGTHYRDYANNSSCNVSYNVLGSDFKKIIVGHNPICPECGSEHNNEKSIICYDCQPMYYCENCEADVYEEDLITTNDGSRFCSYDCAYDFGYVWCIDSQDYRTRDVCIYCHYNEEWYSDTDYAVITADDMTYYDEDAARKAGYEHCPKCDRWVKKETYDYDNDMCDDCSVKRGY